MEFWLVVAVHRMGAVSEYACWAPRRAFGEVERVGVYFELPELRVHTADVRAGLVYALEPSVCAPGCRGACTEHARYTGREVAVY